MTEYEFRHPEQQDDEIYMGNDDPVQPGIKPLFWRTLRYGRTAMISPTLTTSKEWEPLNAPNLRPVFVKVSEVWMKVLDSKRMDAAAAFAQMLDPRWNGVRVVKDDALEDLQNNMPDEFGD